MRNAILALVRLAGILLTVCGSAMSFALNPVRLQCEYQSAPLGIDHQHPRFGWWFESSARDEIQTAYQVGVSSSIENLMSTKFDLWDSGKVASSESAHVVYMGKYLQSNVACFWKVRVWDRAGNASKWSQTATFSTGMFSSEDWQAKWIGATSEHFYTRSPVLYGYHALESKAQVATKWVQIDLGAPHSIDYIVLYSPVSPGFQLKDSFGFPIRFRVDVSDDPKFGDRNMIVDHTDQDFPGPQGEPVRLRGKGIKARYVRVTATKLWNRGSGPEPFCFALSELEVFSGNKNVALNASVSAFDSVENSDWNKKRLTDGVFASLKESGRAVLPENAAIHLRKDISVKKQVTRATAFICGLGYYELSINGKKVGDHVLDPGFTDYDKRILYVTYDVTKALNQGKNELGILLGGGWFNLATPDLFGFEKAPWSASPRALFHLKVEYSDGTSQVVVSNESWKWGESRISFNCVRGGETVDFTRGSPTWKQVTMVDEPKGKLTSQQLPPIRVRQSIKPISVKEPKPGVYVFDLGTNIAGWATLTTRGPMGTKVTLKYNEALTPDGVADMHHTASHTYGRFQTDECILSGKQDVFEPRFTYHGFRYVEVTGLTEKPTLDSLGGKWVTTDPAVAGSFQCSNDRLNRVQDLIVHAYLNNLHSIPT
ncbi:MAG: family 78 glycoside hydrolase catalytic domain, partial [Armatimonadota bacterium]